MITTLVWPTWQASSHHSRESSLGVMKASDKPPELASLGKESNIQSWWVYARSSGWCSWIQTQVYIIDMNNRPSRTNCMHHSIYNIPLEPPGWTRFSILKFSEMPSWPLSHQSFMIVV